MHGLFLGQELIKRLRFIPCCSYAIFVSLELQALALKEGLEKELLPGEKLVWSGEPDPDYAIRQRQRIIGIYLLSWLSTLAVVYFIASFTEAFTASELIRLFFLPFVATILITGLIYVFALRGVRKVIYVVTNKRLMVISGSKRYVHSLYFEDLSKIKRLERPNGTVDFIFTQKNKAGNAGDMVFLGIRSNQAIEALLPQIDRN